MTSQLQSYLLAFKKLRIDRSHGPAPHKPILLLSILQAVQNSLIEQTRIYITPEIVSLFTANWSSLVLSNHQCRFFLPFFHLSSAPFWKLIPKQGYESLLSLKSGIQSFSALNAAVDYALIDEELFLLMKNPVSNAIFKNLLLDEYFPGTKTHLLEEREYLNDKYSEIENKILHEPAEEYRSEIQTLIKQQDEEEIFIRGGIFKREIPKIYNYTCCISGMRIDATVQVSLIDACHIVPFSESYNDTISNGIALCPNLHRAFDRGLISIDEDYRVIVSDKFTEGKSDYSIRKFDRKRINLPSNRSFWPGIQNLTWHKGNVFKL
ncbi:HNH endonuclease [Dyadobacter psychrotolerans]|uniref:HNH endonuclease n=1 Tax=Dyadobacter psychrotolerans TaxID=2541721 RepID=A0A4R5DER2_9BACT|nr:HNH endonuclease [Dyadobacter psychrotolerans]TDE08833.1 HNH endonuclease [Dyadobacter psychrotolerans]